MSGAQQQRPVVGHRTSVHPPHLAVAGETGFQWDARVAEFERLNDSVAIK
jgi:hypothetical protein